MRLFGKRGDSKARHLYRGILKATCLTKYMYSGKQQQQQLKLKIFMTSKGFLCHFGKTTIPWQPQMPYNIYTKWCASSVAQSCPALCDPIDRICQAPLCMGFFRQEDWSGLPFLSPGDLPNPGVKSMSLHFLLGRRSLPSEPPGEPTPSIFELLNLQRSTGNKYTP